MYIHRFTDTIKKTDKVIDLGSGNDPHPRANVFVDFYPDDNYQRDGASFIKPKNGEFINWDLNKYPYPFKKKEFDFVIAAHIAEHVDDPLMFCKEMQRIGKRGYIESPAKFYEQIYGWPFHLWMVYELNGTLVFEPVHKSPFADFGRSLYQENPRFRKIHDENIEYLITSFYWEDKFKCQILNQPEKKKYKYIKSHNIDWTLTKRTPDSVSSDPQSSVRKVLDFLK